MTDRWNRIISVQSGEILEEKDSLSFFAFSMNLLLTKRQERDYNRGCIINKLL